MVEVEPEALTRVRFCGPAIPAATNGLVRALVEGSIGPGAITKQAAEWLRSYTKSPYVLMTTSGTVALYVIAKTLRAKHMPGPEAKALLPAYGIAATANAFAHAQWPLEFVDIDDTGCMSYKALEAAWRPEHQVVVFVNFSGNTPSSLRLIRNFCRARSVTLIEDAACGLGHWSAGAGGRKHAGTLGRMGALSFSVPKIVTSGQGGAVLFANSQDYEYARDLIDHGDADRVGNSKFPGLNLRLPDPLSAMLLEQFHNLDAILAHKAETYKAMSAGVVMLASKSGTPLHNITFSLKRNALARELNNKGIEARTQYGLVPEHTAYKRSKHNDYTTARRWHNTALYLPFGIGMTLAEAQHVNAVLKASIDTLARNDQ